jgi:cytochrome c553
MMLRRSLILLIPVTLLACGGAEETSAPGSTVEDELEAEHEGPTNVEMVAAMEVHYTSAILAHDALIEGDLDKFRSRMAELESHDLPAGSPESWKPFETRLYTSAGWASQATDLDSAANKMAAVAAACGACHEGTGRGPVYPAPPIGGVSDVTKAEMRRHEWAVLMLWDGVTGPSDYAWSRGAEGLADTRIFGEGESEDEVVQSWLAREATLRRLGEEAKSATSGPDRAVLYGLMLATCGDCHQAFDVTIP